MPPMCRRLLWQETDGSPGQQAAIVELANAVVAEELVAPTITSLEETFLMCVVCTTHIYLKHCR